MLLKPAAAQAVSEVSKKKPGPRPGGAVTAGGTAQSGQPRAVLPPALRSSLLRTPVPSDRGLVFFLDGVFELRLPRGSGHVMTGAHRSSGGFARGGL